MKYTIQLITKYTMMPEIFPVDPNEYDVLELTEDDIPLLTEEPGDIPFCFGMMEEYGEIFKIVVKDENDNIVYESEEENDFDNFYHIIPSVWTTYDDGTEDWEEDEELEKIVDAKNDEIQWDTWEAGYYLVKMTQEKWGEHIYEVELDEEFDIKKLQLAPIRGYHGLLDDSWTTPVMMMYGKQFLQYGDCDDDCDFYGDSWYLYRKNVDEYDNHTHTWWEQINTLVE